MSETSDRASFAAAEYIARVEHETGELYPPRMREHTRLVYETAYMRGFGEGLVEFEPRLEEALTKLSQRSDELITSMKSEKALLDSLKEYAQRENELLKQQTAFAEREKELLLKLRIALQRERERTFR